MQWKKSIRTIPKRKQILDISNQKLYCIRLALLFKKSLVRISWTNQAGSTILLHAEMSTSKFLAQKQHDGPEYRTLHRSWITQIPTLRCHTSILPTSCRKHLQSFKMPLKSTEEDVQKKNKWLLDKLLPKRFTNVAVAPVILQLVGIFTLKVEFLNMALL